LLATLVASEEVMDENKQIAFEKYVTFLRFTDGIS
jgi:hypothetical protein